MLGDGPRVVRMARRGRSTGAPCPLWTPRRPSFHPTVSLHTIKPWTRHSCGAMVWHLPHNDMPWRSKPGHTMEIQAGSHNGDPKPGHTMEIQAGSHNGDPKPVHTMKIQAGSYNGDPRRFTQWGSKAGSHNGDPKPGHTMEIQSRFTQWRLKGRFSCMKRKCCWLVLQCCSNVLLLGCTDLDNFFPRKQNQWSPVEAL